MDQGQQSSLVRIHSQDDVRYYYCDISKDTPTIIYDPSVPPPTFDPSVWQFDSPKRSHNNRRGSYGLPMSPDQNNWIAHSYQDRGHGCDPQRKSIVDTTPPPPPLFPPEQSRVRQGPGDSKYEGRERSSNINHQPNQLYSNKSHIIEYSNRGQNFNGNQQSNVSHSLSQDKKYNDSTHQWNAAAAKNWRRENEWHTSNRHRNPDLDSPLPLSDSNTTQFMNSQVTKCSPPSQTRLPSTRCIVDTTPPPPPPLPQEQGRARNHSGLSKLHTANTSRSEDPYGNEQTEMGQSRSSQCQKGNISDISRGNNGAHKTTASHSHSEEVSSNQPRVPVMNNEKHDASCHTTPLYQNFDSISGQQKPQQTQHQKQVDRRHLQDERYQTQELCTDHSHNYDHYEKHGNKRTRLTSPSPGRARGRGSRLPSSQQPPPHGHRNKPMTPESLSVQNHTASPWKTPARSEHWKTPEKPLTSNESWRTSVEPSPNSEYWGTPVPPSTSNGKWEAPVEPPPEDESWETPTSINLNFESHQTPPLTVHSSSTQMQDDKRYPYVASSLTPHMSAMNTKQIETVHQDEMIKPRQVSFKNQDVRLNDPKFVKSEQFAVIKSDAANAKAAYEQQANDHFPNNVKENEAQMDWFDESVKQVESKQASVQETQSIAPEFKSKDIRLQDPNFTKSSGFSIISENSPIRPNQESEPEKKKETKQDGLLSPAHTRVQFKCRDIRLSDPKFQKNSSFSVIKSSDMPTPAPDVMPEQCSVSPKTTRTDLPTKSMDSERRPWRQKSDISNNQNLSSKIEAGHIEESVSTPNTRPGQRRRLQLGTSSSASNLRCSREDRTEEKSRMHTDVDDDGSSSHEMGLKYTGTSSSPAQSSPRVRKTRWSLGTPAEVDQSAAQKYTDILTRESWILTYREECSISDVPYIDSHCHLDFLFRRTGFNGSFAEYSKQEVVSKTTPHNFAGCLAIFCDPSAYPYEKRWKSLLEEENVWGSFGVHPKNVRYWSPTVASQLSDALKHPKIRAFGEIGLDYSQDFYRQKELQQKVFKEQIKIALSHDLPLVIHCRDANDDCLQILKEEVPAEYKIHRHCFTGRWDEIVPWFKHFPNLMIGLTPLVTYASARCVHHVAKIVPLDKLLLETDAPYFTPRLVDKSSEHRNTHPAMAITVAVEVARLRQISLDEVLQHCRKNTHTMYSI